MLENNHPRHVVCRIPGASSPVVTTTASGIFVYAAQSPALIRGSKAVMTGKAIQFAILRPYNTLLTFSALHTTREAVHALLELNCLPNAPLAHSQQRVFVCPLRMSPEFFPPVDRLPHPGRIHVANPITG